MESRALGASGLKVSPLCLGAMTFGALTDEAQARDIVASAREAGVNFIDTGNAYVDGASEETVGRAIAAAATAGSWRPRPPIRSVPARTIADCRGAP